MMANGEGGAELDRSLSSTSKPSISSDSELPALCIGFLAGYRLGVPDSMCSYFLEP